MSIHEDQDSLSLDLFDQETNLSELESSNNNELDDSVSSINPIFLKRIEQRLPQSGQQILMLEIVAGSSSGNYLNMSLRDLLHYLKDKCNTIDAAMSSGNYFAANQIRLRDLRRLDFSFNSVGQPEMLVRQNVILLILDDIRALVMSDRLILIIPDGADAVLSILQRHIIDWSDSYICAEQTYFETHAYEALLSTICTIFQQEYQLFNNDVNDVIKFSRSGSILSIDQQEKMRVTKNSIASHVARLDSYRKVLHDLMENDESMALMNLTLLKEYPQYYLAPLCKDILVTHECIEEMLESFLMDFNSIEAKLNNLKSQLLSCEESIVLRLDTAQNELLIAHTSLTVLTVSIAVGTYIAGAFGMNLYNAVSIETVYGGFFMVFGGSFFLMVLIFIFTMGYYMRNGILPIKIR